MCETFQNFIIFVGFLLHFRLISSPFRQYKFIKSVVSLTKHLIFPLLSKSWMCRTRGSTLLTGYQVCLLTYIEKLIVDGSKLYGLKTLIKKLGMDEHVTWNSKKRNAKFYMCMHEYGNNAESSNIFLNICCWINWFTWRLRFELKKLFYVDFLSVVNLLGFFF